MRRESPFLFPLISIVFCLSAFSQGQNWSGILAPSRAANWTNAGVIGGIPSASWANCVTTACNTLFGGSVTLATINSAISSAPANTVVRLPAGTFNLATTDAVNLTRSNVVLRGQGANQTKLRGGRGGCGFVAAICMSSGVSDINSATSVAVTAIPAKGATSLNVASNAGLSAGMYFGLDQLDDSNTDTHQIWICEVGNVCVDEGPSGYTRNGSARGQQEYHKVTSIAGNTINFTPPAIYPNWRVSKSPEVFFKAQVVNVGLEDLTLSTETDDVYAAIQFESCYSCWIRGVRNVDVATGSNVRDTFALLFNSAFITIQDSYTYGATRFGSESAGIEFYDTSNNLIQNNIFVHIIAPFYLNGGGAGSVISYNYNIDNPWTVDTSSINATVWMHATGGDFMLFEGNAGIGWWSDDIHGTHIFNSNFRNQWYGIDPANPGRTGQNTPLIVRAFGRYYNAVGNVLGTSGRQTAYSQIYDLDAAQHPGGPVPNDSLVTTSLMRWGNYDTGTATVRFLNAEVPSSFNDGSGSPSLYVNAVPASQTLPASFYLNSKPSWFGSIPWPAIGPDVSGGNVANVGGHANKNPAQSCFEGAANDPAYAANTVRIFNAAACYAGDPPPDAPTGLFAVAK
jgi:hypothetical protein